MKKISVYLSIWFFILIGCKPNFENYEQYLNSPKEKREIEIRDILKDNKLTNDNKLIIEYIDFLLVTPEYYKKLEKQFPLVEFDLFFEKVVPIIYHTFDKNNFTITPQELKENVTESFINLLDYPYSYGEKAFKENCRNIIEELFIQINNNEDISLYLNQRHLLSLMYFLGSDKFTFEIFKNLPTSEQAHALEVRISFKAFQNNKYDDNKKFIDKLIKEEWINGSYYYLNNMENLPDDTPFRQVTEEFLNLVSKRYSNKK